MSSAPKRIGIAVVEHHGRYLVGVRGPDGPLPGYAEFPGGKCADNEAPRETALRECREETGLTVTAAECLLNRQYRYAHDEVDLHFWLCHPANADEVRDDHQSFHWVTPDALTTLQFPEANEPLLDLIRQRDQP